MGGFINCTGSSKVCEPVRPTSPDPSHHQLVDFLPSRNIPVGIYKLSQRPSNLFLSGPFLLLFLFFFSFLLFIVHRPRIVTTTIDSLYALLSFVLPCPHNFFQARPH